MNETRDRCGPAVRAVYRTERAGPATIDDIGAKHCRRSGLGHEGGQHGLLELTESKYIAVDW